MRFKTAPGNTQKTSESSWDLVRADQGPPPGTGGVAKRLAAIGHGLAHRFGNPELLGAATWDSPEWTIERLAEFERDFAEAAADLRDLVERSQRAKQKWERDS